MLVLILVGVGIVVPLASTLMLWNAHKTAPIVDEGDASAYFDGASYGGCYGAAEVVERYRRNDYSEHFEMDEYPTLLETLDVDAQADEAFKAEVETWFEGVTYES